MSDLHLQELADLALKLAKTSAEYLAHGNQDYATTEAQVSIALSLAALARKAAK